jgi:hypothetical protein
VEEILVNEETIIRRRAIHNMTQTN